MKKKPNTSPTEAQEQRALFRWAEMHQGKFPDLALMFHIPNEGKRSQVGGYLMREAGLKKGVPDIFLPVPRGGCHGLFIELKRQRGSKITAEQKEWQTALRAQGYASEICKGAVEAADVIKAYLRGSIDTSEER